MKAGDYLLSALDGLLWHLYEFLWPQQPTDTPPVSTVSPQISRCLRKVHGLPYAACDCATRLQASLAGYPEGQVDELERLYALEDRRTAA